MLKGIFFSTVMMIFLVPATGVGAAPVNDTGTHLLSYGNGIQGACSVIRPLYGYITDFGDHGGDGAAIVLGLEVSNLGMAKEVWLGINGQWQKAIYNSSPTGAGPSIRFLGSEGNVDSFETLDERIGPENAVAVDASVKINGVIYNCPAIKIGR